MSETIIVKNLTENIIKIFDLGEVQIPASGQYDIGADYPVDVIYNSESLKTEINNDNVIINNGSQDFDKIHSLTFVRYENLHRSQYTGFPRYHYFADQMQNPVSDDWAVNSLAPASADSLNSGLIVRLFDDTTEEGVGFIIETPSNATNICFMFRSKAETAPGSAKQVVPRIYVREIKNNVTVESWSSGLDLTAIDIPTNEYFQYDCQIISLSTLNLTAGDVVQIEITRNPDAASDNLIGDWCVLETKISFI